MSFIIQLISLYHVVRRKRSQMERRLRPKSELNCSRHLEPGDLDPLAPVVVREHVPSLHRGAQHLKEAALPVGSPGSDLLRQPERASR